MKIPPKTEDWDVNFKLPECPSCKKPSLLLERQLEDPFLKWRCEVCDHEIEYG
tara:strand:- start:103 stop:261 length:159 start_codon:yes stop_codon:yes gene_type:complete